MKSISIVIPTYNERENIEKLIPNVEGVLKRNEIIGEIIIIDDNSPDGTGKLAEELNKKYKNIKVIER
ncbi:MAG: glycosyltransferase, partial [Nanoarchaeota archaeon]